LLKTRFGRVLKTGAVVVSVAAAVLLVSVLVSAVATPACTLCHAPEAKALAKQTPGHPTTPCARCHAGDGAGERLGFGVRQVFGMVLRVVPLNDPTIASVPNAICVGCHPQSKGVTSGATLRIKHSVCGAGALCTDCHAGSAHDSTVTWKRRPDMSACVACHTDNNATVACDACHGSRTPTARLATGSIWILHGANWRSTHAMGNMKVCIACHKQDFCGRCHGAAVPHSAAFKIDHGASSRASDAKCLTCHKRAFCEDCHRIAMPHPEGFVKTHSALVKADGDALCKRCHAAADCNTCHLMHVHPGGAVR
jgi:hypothetical protein